VRIEEPDKDSLVNWEPPKLKKPPFNLEVEARGYEPDKDLTGINIRNCLMLIKNNFKYLSFKLSCPQVHIVAVAMCKGCRRLWSFEGMDEIKTAHMLIYNRCPDSEDLQWFERAFFDFETSNTGRFYGRLPAGPVSQCKAIANILGLHDHVIYQLSFMAGLISGESVPDSEVNKMVNILRRFRAWITRRAIHAKELQERYEVRPESETVTRRLSWADVMTDVLST
jgi:hypothetical protein